MMLLLDFALACVDCTGGNKKKQTTEAGSITILTERYLSVNNKKELDQNQESSPLLR